MAADALVDQKFEASKELSARLVERHAPLLAAYWEFDDDAERWKLQLVPRSRADDRSLIHQTTNLLVEKPFRDVFSIIDPAVDGNQINRAKALGAYIRTEPYVGRQIDKTFTGNEYFESVLPVYFAHEILTHLRAA